MADNGKVNIRGKEYTTVAARVQAFREKHGDKYGIETEIVSADEDRVVMRAVILRHEVDGFWIVGTGHAEEVRSSSQINRTSALENAETSAIGRALAAFGMAGTEFASADEVAQAITQQSAPVPKRAPASSTLDPADRPATGAQKSIIKSYLMGMGVADENMATALSVTYGAHHPLNAGEARRVIDEIEGGKKVEAL